MVMMFPYSGEFHADFDFKGSTVVASSSDDKVDNFYLSHVSTDNQTAASLNVSLDSPGFTELFSNKFNRK